ncbi:phosphatidate cytidylyltransferase [Mangrovibrevibacter kandeliae]|uniref:phosphatidate cytidylyltransferase n=1 Tax=Mangrovibrevibacter kandeliae TaxID=2968473 RepID=UPI00211924CE|nr:phosphatidate cytidylyltransferase [Aurantimonas sp. CSK15Z-1]
MTLADALPVKSWSDLRSRLISAVVLAVFVIAVTLAGGWPFRLLCVLSGLIVFEEWARITRARRAGPLFTLGRRATWLALALFLFGLPVAALVVVVAVCIFLWLVDRREREASWLLAGIGYTVASSVLPGMLRGDSPEGLAVLAVVMAVVWASDIAAYFTGRAIGGPKLLPSVSPKKTVSGALGGLAAGIVFGVVTFWLFGGEVGVFAVVLTGLLSVVGQAGDLFESWVKRRFGVKDSGRIIPGHGGLMDRIDALIAATAATWLIGVLLSGLAHPARAIIALQLG